MQDIRLFPSPSGSRPSTSIHNLVGWFTDGRQTQCRPSDLIRIDPLTVDIMSNTSFPCRDATLLYPNESVESVELDAEVIFYSRAKHGYFGVSGVAVEILKVSRRFREGIGMDSLIKEVAGGRSLDPEDTRLIEDGVATLLDLGGLYEK